MGAVARHVEVARGDLERTRVVEEDLRDLDDGEVLVAVDAFALTTNTITYARMGDRLGYWGFFPAEGGWGRIPVWGFADVVASRAQGVAQGARVFGFLPMSSHLVMRPGRVTPAGFADEARHRASLPGAYNAYRLTAADPLHRPEREAQHMLLWPLFATSFLIDDLLGERMLFGAGRVVVSSASSRTASGAAFLLHERQGVEVVGLTSPANRDVVAALGVYDRVVTYPEIRDLARVSSVYVDFAGSAAVRRAVHERLRDDLRHSLLVGFTHAVETDDDAGLPGPAPTFFFAPDRIHERGGLAGLPAAWERYLPWTDTWLRIEEHRGPDAVLAVYRDALAGRLSPATGHVLSLRS